MAPEENVQQEIDQLVKGSKVLLFMKGNRQAPQCGFSSRVVSILDDLLDSYETFDVLSRADIRQGVKDYASWPTIPQLYVDGEFVGGCDIITEMAGSGELHQALGMEMPEVSEPSIEISDAASRVFADAPASEGNIIRLSISRQFQYEFGIGPVGDFDFVVESNGARLAIDRMSASRADGLQIDFVEDGGRSGFKIVNPNEASDEDGQG